MGHVRSGMPDRVEMPSPGEAVMRSVLSPAPVAASLHGLHAKARDVLDFVVDKQPKADMRKLSPDEFAQLRRLEAEVIAACSVLGIPVPVFPNPADSGPFWNGCHRLGTLKIPYAMMGLDNPKPMLLPTPDWFQAMRTFVLSLEMRAGAPPSPAGFQPVQASSADPGAGNRPGKPNGNTATPAAGHPLFVFRDLAERIVREAPAAYWRETMNCKYWDQFGLRPSNRTNELGALLRGIADQAIAEISVAGLWGRLGTTMAELNGILHEVTWHLAQAAGMPFPHSDDRHPNADANYVQQIERLTAQAAGHLLRLRPFWTCLEALLTAEERDAVDGVARTATVGASEPTPEGPTVVIRAKGSRQRTSKTRRMVEFIDARRKEGHTVDEAIQRLKDAHPDEWGYVEAGSVKTSYYRARRPTSFGQ